MSELTAVSKINFLSSLEIKVDQTRLSIYDTELGAYFSMCVPLSSQPMVL